MKILTPESYELVIEWFGENQETLDEAVHEVKSNEAAEINNDGFVSQIAYLLSLEEDDVRQIAKERGYDGPVD